MTLPRASILVPVGGLPERAENCLRGLAGQPEIGECEVIVVDTGQAEQQGRFARFPRVRYFHRPDLWNIGRARLFGLEQAAAPLVLCLEDHTRPRPGWLAAVLGVFEGHPEVLAVNYALANMPPVTYWRRAFHLLEYGPWAAPARAGAIRYACHHNMAYRRAAVLEIVGGDAEKLELEFEIHREMVRRGGVIWLAAGAVIEHESWYRMRDGLAANGSLKRVIAAVRAERGGWGRAKRLAWAGAMALSPPLHTWRLVRTLGRRPALWGELLYTLPVIVVVYCYTAAAEALGYVRGAGAARATFARVEFDVRRDGEGR